MFKKISAIVTAALSCFALTSCSLTKESKKEVVRNTEVPPKMLFLGDSIAAGYGLDGYSAGDLYSCDSYANILDERYSSELAPEAEQSMVNRAISGYTSQELIDLLKSGDLDSDLSDSDAVVISIGGNDMLGIFLDAVSKLGLTINEDGSVDTSSVDILSAGAMLMGIDSELTAALDQFELNIVEISDIIHEKTGAKLFIQNLYDPLEYFSDFKSVTTYSDKKMNRFNSIVSEKAEGRYTVVDISTAFEGKNGELTNIASFDIHPNAEGHKVIADTVDEAFRAEGFSYTITENSGRKFTPTAVMLICAGFAVLIAAAFIAIRRVGRQN